MPVPIPIVDDDIDEDAEYLNLTLSTSDPDVQLGPGCAVEITDNDGMFVGTHVLCITSEVRIRQLQLIVI